MATKTEIKNALAEWEVFYTSLITGVDVDKNESEADRMKRKAFLEKDGNQEEWFKYYFPKYYKYAPADFQIEDTKRILKHRRYYSVRAWSRGFAKSTRTMFERLYLALTGRRKNIVLTSYSAENAEKLLLPYKLNFEKNERIIQDYGEQITPGSWTSTAFFARCGCMFACCGAGQSPRGAKNEEIRPDDLLIDDIDTDEECRNPDRINAKWEWIEQALIPTVDITEDYTITFLGNIIAKDCCITRAIKKADHADIINLIDEQGNSNWPDKVKPEDIKYIRSKISEISFQKEYMNNPLSVGEIFKEITWGPIPPLHKFPFLINYGDPAFSDSRSKKSSFKCQALIGILEGKLYIITCYLDQVVNDEFINWYYYIRDYVKERAQVYNYIENNKLQDPFYQQVFSPLFAAKAKERGHYINIAPDERRKPDKFIRIEGNLEAVNRRSGMIFNSEEKDNPHMQRLEEQFKAITPSLKFPADGPDAVEGGYWIANNKLSTLTQTSISIGIRPTKKTRY